MTRSRAELSRSTIPWIVLVLLGTGCESTTPVEERVAAYWQARAARDFSASYELEDPESDVTKEQYVTRLASGSVEYLSVAVRDIEVDGDEATADLEIVYRVLGLSKAVTGRTTDVWWKRGRQWHHRMAVEPATSSP